MKRVKVIFLCAVCAFFAFGVFVSAPTAAIAADDAVPETPVYGTVAVQKLQDDLRERLKQFHASFDSRYLNADVWLDTVPGEKAPANEQILFHGAWYYNTQSSMDSWMGVDGVVTLPEVRYDDDRINEDTGRYLDNSSVYMGVTGIRESDVGVTWERVCEDSNEDNPSLSVQGMAFRPFWRYINASGNNLYYNADKFFYQTYFFPGDTIRLALLGTSPEKCVLYVKLLKQTTIPKYVAFRNRFDIREEFEFVSEEFDAPGLLTQDTAFKVANAIDQANNEGKPTKKTRTAIVGAIWHNTYLYREIGGAPRKVPFNTARTVLMAAPSINGFVDDRNHPLNATTGYRTLDIIPEFATDYNPQES